MMPNSSCGRSLQAARDAVLALATVLFAAAPAIGAPLLDEAFLLGDQYQPASSGFELATTGDYVFRLNDLRFPQPLGTATAMLTRGASPVATLSTFGSAPVSLQSGRHKVLVAATPASASGFGAFGVSLQPAAGGASVLDYSDRARSIQTDAPSLQSTLQATFDVATPGTYSLAVTDLGFPGPLQRLDVLVTTATGAVVARLSPSSPTADAALVAGRYNVIAFAEATEAAKAGAYALSVVGSGSQPYAQVHPVGALRAGNAVELGNGGTHTLQVVDLAVPAPLERVHALVTRGDAVLVRTDGPGSTDFSAAAGGAIAFVWQSPGSGFNRGVSSVSIVSGASTVFERVEATSPAQTSGEAVLVAVPVEIASAGAYRFELSDFAFPASAETAAMYVVQGGAAVGALAAPGAVDATVTAGGIYLLLDAAPNALTRSSLLGTRVLQPASSAVIAETTLALGILLQTRSIEVPASGRYDLTVTDLAFPSALADLALAVTRDGQRVASIYGSGSVRFTASPGRYALNLLARTTGTQGFGAYALLLDAAPPPPVIAFSASPTRIRQGATTQLTWSASGATTCAASDGWTGTRPTSGTFTSAALNAGTRFTITCSGPGGSTTSSIDVEVRPVDTSGGGGAGGPVLLALLAGLALGGCVARRA